MAVVRRGGGCDPGSRVGPGGTSGTPFVPTNGLRSDVELDAHDGGDDDKRRVDRHGREGGYLDAVRR